MVSISQMASAFFESLDSRSQEWLNSLSVEDCKEFQGWLKRRIKYLNGIPYFKKKIEVLNLSTRAYNALKKNDLHTIEDVVLFGMENIRLIRNIGSKTVVEIKHTITSNS